MLKFEALHIPLLTEEVALSLADSLKELPGIEQLTINLETKEVHIVFDAGQLDFLTLTQAMAKAGCPLRNINVALLKNISR